MFTTCLPQTTLSALEWLIAKNSGYLQDKKFYLAGGTALALQIGHRISNDLDWFTAIPFDEQQLNTQITDTSGVDVRTTKIDKQTIYLELNDTKVSFIYYPYELLDSQLDWRGIELAGLLDIALMKISAIGSRGIRRDFIDLYFILLHKKISLADLFLKFEQKYPQIDKYHFLKSLTFFEDADNDNTVNMINPLEWQDVKQFFIEETKRVE